MILMSYQYLEGNKTIFNIIISVTNVVTIVEDIWTYYNIYM